jgi:diphosphomevalonate decarboxylase
VEWVKGSSDETSFARQVFAVDYWDVRVLVVLLSQQKKRVSSTDGQAVAATSPFYKTRIEMVEERLKKMKRVIQKKDFSELGKLAEDEALNMHAVMLTSRPNLIYWLPETVRVMQAVQEWREMGLESYFTINTGQNVFVLCQPENESELVKRLSRLKGVERVIREKIGWGARLL